ncbi:MAG: hypothetical protein WBD47_02930 [Phormidesmis sp.]
MTRFDWIRRVIGPGVAIAGLLGATMLIAQPARAGSLGEDAAVGAGVGVVTGVIFGNGIGLDNAANGAAAGVAVHAADEELRRNEDRSIVQDVGVGAVTAGAVGTITNDDGFLENAAQGAAVGAVIHVLD